MVYILTKKNIELDFCKSEKGLYEVIFYICCHSNFIFVHTNHHHSDSIWMNKGYRRGFIKYLTATKNCISWSKNVMCHSPHQKKSNSLVPEHVLSAHQLCKLLISQLSSLLLHSLTYVLGCHLPVWQPNQLLSHHCSLCLCSVMKMSVLMENYWGLVVQTAALWLGFVFEKSWAELMILWTQQQPLPAVYGQRRVAGPGFGRLPL